MGVRLFHIDAFTDEPFAGNPAAVCLLPAAREESWMQQVAREMNLSETAFLVKQADGYNLRWFTPTVEVELCGHATLASAHALWEAGELPPDAPARFSTRSGWLTAERQGDWIEMNFPAEPPEPATPPPGLLEGLGARPSYVGRNRLHWLLELESEAAVRALQPDFARLAADRAPCVVVTSRAENSWDFVSRFFAPTFGVNEDPVTGSAHCSLGPYWKSKLGKDSFLAFQASVRGGVVRVRVQGDRVLLGGQAVTVFRGELS